MSSIELSQKVDAWLSVINDSNHYEILGILELADEAAVQEAFHAFAEAFHPDRHRTEAPALRSGVDRIFRRGAEAYRVLRNPRTRAAYDLELAKARQATSSDTQIRSLDELCTTAGGRLHARQAERAITEGDLRQAVVVLTKALQAEGENPDLAERLVALREMEKISGE